MTLVVWERMFGHAWPLRASVRDGLVLTWLQLLNSQSVPCIVSLAYSKSFKYFLNAYWKFLIYMDLILKFIHIVGLNCKILKFKGQYWKFTIGIDTELIPYWKINTKIQLCFLCKINVSVVISWYRYFMKKYWYLNNNRYHFWIIFVLKSFNWLSIGTKCKSINTQLQKW